MAVGTGRKARLCCLGGVVRSDPEADLSLQENGTRPVTLLAVTYEGVLQVTDPEAFKALLCEGVGRGKAYGLGLMTIIHRRGDHG